MPKGHNAAPLSGPVPSKVCGGPCGQMSKTKLFTEAEAAKQMNISATSLYRRRKDGTIRHYRKLGRLIRYTQEDIARNIGTMRPTLAPPETRILAAVHEGKRTADEIRHHAGIAPSRIDGLLADMVLNRRKLVTKAVGEVRHYYALPS